jgi:hypothetical protein
MDDGPRLRQASKDSEQKQTGNIFLHVVNNPYNSSSHILWLDLEPWRCLEVSCALLNGVVFLFLREVHKVMSQ